MVQKPCNFSSLLAVTSCISRHIWIKCNFLYNLCIWCQIFLFFLPASISYERAATATKTSLEKWIRSASIFIARIPSRLIRQMLQFLLESNSKRLYQTSCRKRKRNLLSCVPILERKKNRSFVERYGHAFKRTEICTMTTLNQKKAVESGSSSKHASILLIHGLRPH